MAIKKRKLVLTARERKKIRIRRKLRGTDSRPRITVFRSSKHIYAQVISDESQKTLVSTASDEKGFAETIDLEAAKDVSKNESKSKKLAEKLKEKGISEVVFDRNGYQYHGRIKALAEGARSGGIKF
ncbi:UNVERIFIED_CONTAM: hypothetical protein GTU68_000014 [Idotea baltica]|nr:hypothetical protein [Idotea baltica]